MHAIVKARTREVLRDMPPDRLREAARRHTVRALYLTYAAAARARGGFHGYRVPEFMAYSAAIYVAHRQLNNHR